MDEQLRLTRSAYERAGDALACRAVIVRDAAPRRYYERGLVSDNGERGSAQRCNVDALFGWDDLSALMLDYESLRAEVAELKAELKGRPTKDGFEALTNAFWKQQDRAIKAEGEAAILRQELATGGNGYADDLSAKLGKAEDEITKLVAQLDAAHSVRDVFARDLNRMVADCEREAADRDRIASELVAARLAFEQVDEDRERLRGLLRELAMAPVSFEDARVEYVEIQVEKSTLLNARNAVMALEARHE